ncbi:hypothetical protein ACIQXD_35100 [Streptomyces uncialis]
MSSPSDAHPSNTPSPLENWRPLTRLRTYPAHTTHLLRALGVLANLEVNR